MRLLCQSVFGRETRLVERVDSARGPLRAALPCLRHLPFELSLFGASLCYYGLVRLLLTLSRRRSPKFPMQLSRRARPRFRFGLARSNREPRLRGGYAQGLGARSWHMKRQKLSSRPTTRWDELMTVR